ncbi:unnamed protein product [Urochloa decumbens]|uniref:Uncharacterized protein n=1 Tax=Urochloa decumbens TaxID=240449 RepID=A0ABC9GED1_9POAL
MAPSRSRAASDPASSGWSSSLRPPLDLKPALVPEDADDDDDRAVAELLVAALEGDLSRAKKLAKELRKAGVGVDEAVAAADVGVTGIKRRGPLHLAAANGKAEMCKFLIRSCEVDVNATDADGATALTFAVQGTGSIATIRLLLSCGADPNKTDSIGVAPLHIAAERGSYEIAELLLSKEAEVDPICENGGAPIHVSAENGHGKVLKLLLQHKADYDRHSRSFSTPLAASLISPSVDCLEMLIEAGADVNAGSPLTPLVIAAGKGLTDCIKCLLKADADANIPDENGKLPIQIAARQVSQLLNSSWLQPLDSDDKENAGSDANNKDTLPDLPKSSSDNGTASTMEEGTGKGIESLLSDLNLGPEDPADKASSVQGTRLPLRRSTREAAQRAHQWT